MARRVFFSFHYERDIWRVSQVRNSWVTKPSIEEAGYVDSAAWEEVKKKGTKEVEKWIDEQLKGTSVTVVLIGTETSERDYVMYEIKRSYAKGNGMLGIYIHKQGNKEGKSDVKGSNPFGKLYVEENGAKKYLSSMYPTYDWSDDDGYNNLGSWVEAAAKKAGK